MVNPNVFIAMNLPSFDKFINDVEPGSIVIVDSFLINKKVERDDITAFYVPLPNRRGQWTEGLANIILVGKLFHETNFCTEDASIKRWKNVYLLERLI